MNKKNEKHIPYFALMEVLPEEGCPVCNLIQKQVHNYFDNLLYSGITSVPFQVNFNKTGGFCRRHTYQFADYHDGLAVALTYKLMLANMIEKLEKKSLKDFLKKKEPQCMVCDIEQTAEKRYLALLHEYFNEPAVHTAFEQSDGLCLPHFQMYNKLYRKNQEFNDFHLKKFKALSEQTAEYVDTSNFTSRNHDKYDKDNVIWKKLIYTLYGFRR